jgi:hypothetical protein
MTDITNTPATAPTTPSALAAQAKAETTKNKPRVRAGTPPAAPPNVVPITEARDPLRAAAEVIAEAAGKQTLAPADDAEDLPPAIVDPLLAGILAWKRPYNSTGEMNFMSWLHGELNRRKIKFQVGAGGNVVVIVMRPDKKMSTVLFSCHTDTVHSDCLGGHQKLCYDASLGHIFLDRDDPMAGSCLGADDGAGIWLMLNMLEAKVPGTYVFHRGEEKGGIGSRIMRDKEQAFLEQYEIAIAFDRKGKHDIITHQGGQRCASDKCGLALAARLKEASAGLFNYTLCTGGTFTDTKVYRDVIAECFNISVGYEDAHSKDESLDYDHLCRLSQALCKIDFDSLPIDRDPKAVEAAPQYGYNRNRAQGAYPDLFPTRDDDDGFGISGGGYGFYRGDKDKTPAAPAPKPAANAPAAGARHHVTRAPEVKLNPEPALLDELRMMDIDEMRAIVEEDSEVGLDVIVSLFAELEAAYKKIETYRNLLGLQ